MNKAQRRELCRATERLLIALPSPLDDGENAIAINAIQELLNLNVGLADPEASIRRMKRFARAAERVDATR